MVSPQIITALVNKAKAIGVRVIVDGENDEIVAEFVDSQTFEFTGDVVTVDSTDADITFIEDQLDQIVDDREKRMAKAKSKKSRRKSADEDEVAALAA